MALDHNEEKLTPLVWAGVIVIVLLSLIPFIRNYKYNDNHLNWLNHDYGKNLMVSTEEDSVFMTEGGDNQVFGTLYFTYAEKLRPDLTPYDQKGNIFKKIYGDMRYINDAQTLPRRMNLVDTHLFMSEEPFYENPRDAKDPYFIPYWEGKRPVYLTWQRPEPWTLGDYYYKRYGIMYKVQNIEFSLVDYLELKQSISIEEAREQFASWLHRPIDISYTINKIRLMEKEGFIRLTGDRVAFIKMYPSPHEGDYFSNLLLRWHDAPNAMFWDNLSREIIMNYDYQMGEIYREKIGELQDIRSREQRKNILAEIDKRIKDNWQKAMACYNDALIYGSDSISMLHNIAVVFMKNGIENLDGRARELLNNALAIYRNSWGTYSLALSFVILDSFKNPENEAENMKEADKWLLQLKSELMHYRSGRPDYTKHPLWRNFEGLDRFITSLKQNPTSQLLGMVSAFSNEMNNNPSKFDANLAQSVITLLYSRGIPLQYQPYVSLADNFFDKTIQLKRNDYAYLSWAFNIALQTQKLLKAYDIGKLIERQNAALSDFSFYYSMGMVGYSIHNYPEAERYLNKFMEAIRNNKDAMIKDRELINNAQTVLSQIKTGNKEK